MRSRSRPRHEVFNLIAMGDAGHVLLDNGAVIQNRRHIMTCRSDELDSAGMGGVVGARAGEGGEKRVVHVDDGGWVAGYKIRGEDLHVTGQHDELNVVTGEEVELNGLGLGAPGGGDGNVLEGDAVEGGEGLHVAMVGHDDGDFTAESPERQRWSRSAMQCRYWEQKRATRGRWAVEMRRQFMPSSTAMGAKAVRNFSRSNGTACGKFSEEPCG